MFRDVNSFELIKGMVRVLFSDGLNTNPMVSYLKVFYANVIAMK